MSSRSERLRREFAAGDAIRDAGLTTPADVERFDDIPYGDHPQQALDVYRPKGERGPLPVIVNVHGGGWVYGDKELYQYYAMDLARRGFAVVNFSYRLAPETKFPAQIEDVNAAFVWTEDHAGRYGFDLNRLFAVGDSAGANLLGLYCNLCTNPAYAGALGFSHRIGPTPRAVSLACGAYTIHGEGEKVRPGDLELMSDLMPGPVDASALAKVDVRRYVTRDFPPAFVFTCTADFLQEQAEDLQRTLRLARVPHLLRFYGDADHPLGHVFHENIRSDMAILCNDEQCDFFRRVAEGRF